MQKKVLVNVKGTQFLDGETDVTELITTGSLYEKNGKRYILYDEVLDESAEVTKNTLKLSEDEVELIRHGGSHMNIVFRKNEKSDSYYMTPFGSMKLTFSTKSVEIDDSRQGEIFITIKYEIMADYREVSDYLMEISIKEI
ncbi:MAG: DUF1934 domain-containing protein [Lachnospiraceae bacterium]|nr:DUF1934 domain-containing protein [Lachnospiraceae bacterium]